MPLLASMRVAEVMGRSRVIFDARNGIGEAADKLGREGLPGAPVVDETGAFIGVVQRDALVQAAGPDGDAEVSRLADPTAPTTNAADRLDSALEALMSAGANWVPVLDEHRRVAGILSTSGVVRGYRAGLRANLRQISQVAPDTVVVDERVRPGAPVTTRPLSDLGLPPGTIVMTLQRKAELMLPRGDTVLQAGDQVGVLTHSADAGLVRDLLLGSELAAGGGAARPAGATGPATTPSG
ncbi:MAG: TrkA C-terminal domain-containing protein [Acidimicrobiales bacterium]